MAVSHNPEDRIAITDFWVIKRFDNYSLVKFQLKTGRTHQIRVHCAYLNHPIVGDPVYGYKHQAFKLNGQLLHSQYIQFIHPRTKETLNFSAPIPTYFQQVLDKLEKHT